MILNERWQRAAHFLNGILLINILINILTGNYIQISVFLPHSQNLNTFLHFDQSDACVHVGILYSKLYSKKVQINEDMFSI